MDPRENALFPGFFSTKRTAYPVCSVLAVHYRVAAASFTPRSHGRAGRCSIRTGRPACCLSVCLSFRLSRLMAQKVSFQPLSVPVSCAAVSWTRSFQVPLAVSEEAFTV